jgi:hypothetical protein
MLKLRKRKRGGIGKRRKKHEPSDNKITFDFLNIRGFNSKVRELNRVSDRDNVDFIGLAETFLRSNSRPTKLDDRYEWIGKCRSNGKGKGGLGMCISNRVTILDENLIKSRDDHFERFWMLLKINGVKTALGVTYFPNDGTDKLKTDELFMNYLEMFPSFLLWVMKSFVWAILTVNVLQNALLPIKTSFPRKYRHIMESDCYKLLKLVNFSWRIL